MIRPMPFPELSQTLTQIIEGYDIPVPQKMLKVSEETANHSTNLPYSLAENLWHTVYWQDLWLARLKAKPEPPSMEVWNNDWQTPDPKEFIALRTRFLEGLIIAKDMAENDTYNCDQERAQETLNQIAIHAAYHIGQMNFLKRYLRDRSKT